MEPRCPFHAGKKGVAEVNRGRDHTTDDLKGDALKGKTLKLLRILSV